MNEGLDYHSWLLGSEPHGANMYYPLFPLHKNFKQRTAIRALEETMSGKWLNSRTYGLLTLLFSIPGILSIAVSQVYLPGGSLYALPLLVISARLG
jgi:hypothetical protein